MGRGTGLALSLSFTADYSEDSFMMSPEFAMGRKPGVLVVDDEPAVRVVLSVGLRRLGFPVWEAANGDEAVRIYKQHRDCIEAVLLDVCLPGVDSPAALAR